MVLVKLKTNDNVIITVERSLIRKSKMIVNALRDLKLATKPDATREEIEEYENPEPIVLEKVNKVTFDNVLKWCEAHRDESEHLESVMDDAKAELPHWDLNFFQSLTDRVLLDLMISANFLDMAKLRLLIAMRLRDKVRGAGPEEIRRIFAKAT